MNIPHDVTPGIRSALREGLQGLGPAGIGLTGLSPDSGWTLLDESGGSAVSFTSFISISYSSTGQALSYPVEEGAFANYNKTSRPRSIKLTLSTQGSDSDLEYILLKLDQYQREAVLLCVVTPSAIYESMTLDAHDYSRSRENGANTLTVQLSLVEVREVGTTALDGGAIGPISIPRNPTSALLSQVGKLRTQVLNRLL